MKTYTTWTVELSSTSRYGSNTVYYFRTEAEAKRRAAELTKQFKDILTQKVILSSHEKEA